MKCYLLENITNMHVGSGDINFGVVDNLVQKDAITEIPVIHSSSLKGAFRDHFEEIFSKGEIIDYIFGGENNSSENKRPGAYTFFEAKLLTRPVRSNKALFFNATTPEIIQEFLEMCDIAGIEFEEKEALKKLAEIKVDNIIAFSNYDDIYLEDEKVDVKEINEDIEKAEKILGKNIALYSFEKFKNLDLPFIARNKLNEDGTSENLWYEEVVPSKSKFYFFIQKPKNIADKDKEKIEKFDEKFEKIDVIQVGANRSIGYGFCRLKEVK